MGAVMDINEDGFSPHCYHSAAYQNLGVLHADPAVGDKGLATGDEGPGMRDESLSLGGDEVVPEGQQRATPVMETVIDLEDGIAYIDVPAYPPPVQTPPSPKWSSGSLPISPAPSIVPSHVSSPMIPLTVPSPVASPATAETEGFLTELGVRVEMQRGLIRDHMAGQTDAHRTALWHAISDTLRENRELRLEIAEERRVRLDLAEIVNSMMRGYLIFGSPALLSFVKLALCGLKCLELIVVTNQTVPISQAENPLFTVKLGLGPDIDGDPNHDFEEYIQAWKMKKLVAYVETEFPAIVIDDACELQDALSCKSQVSTPVNDEIDFRISFDESDDEDYTIIYMAPLPPHEQRHPFLRYQGLEYTDADIADFEERLERIYSREIHMVQFVDFLRMLELMRDGLFARMVMEHHDDAGVVIFTSLAWGRLFDTRGPLVRELILEFFSTLRFGEVLLDLDAPDTIQFQLGEAMRLLSLRHFILALGLHTGDEMKSLGFARYWSESERMILGKGDLHDYWRDISTPVDFLGPPPSYTLIRDPVLRLYHRMIAHNIVGRSQAPEKVTVTDLFYLRRMDVGSVNIPYLLARYLRLFAVGRKSGAHISGGQFVARLAGHFGLLTAEILGGLTVIALKLPIIDMGELVRLQICMKVDDTRAWVAMRPERQPDAAAGAPNVAQDAPIVDEGDQADPAPIHAPPPPPSAPARTMPQRMARLKDDVYEIRGALTEQREVFDAMAHDFSRDVKLDRGPNQSGSKFSTIVHEYVMEPSRIFKLNARMGKIDDFKCVEAEDRSNLKTLL
ncbi:hypothetical protein Tco_0705779 [Tanacetum coccineum]|uniref:Uncharacterized protein n=1 Tax=Tanacetum coccineum TaxID=301880 RepID=A0ABQ4Y738_9ASTR